MAARMGITSQEKEACTSQLCRWNDMSRKKVNPCRLSDINYSKPKRIASDVPTVPTPKKVKKFTNVTITEEDFSELKTFFPQAAVLTSIESQNTRSDSGTDTASECECLVPEPLSSVFDPAAKTLDQHELTEKCHRVYEKIKEDNNISSIKMLAEITEKQRECQTWHVHRAGRVTGSILHSVVNSTDRGQNNMVKKIMQYNKRELTVPAVVWGRNQEEKALASYSDSMKEHLNFTVKRTGLTVSEEYPFLAASPDALLSCDCCGTGVVEIKCPFKYKSSLTGAINDKSFCLDENMMLKKSHKYYSQVQLEMHVCKVSFCDFFVWTESEVAKCRILKDDKYMSTAIKKAESFFHSYILPELVTRSSDPAIVQDVCIVCKCPYFGKVISCEKCLKSFHYRCVNVKRFLKSWKCSNCEESI